MIRKNLKRRRGESILQKILVGLGLTILSLYVLLPLVNMLFASIKPLEEIQITGKGLIPSRFDFGTYVRMWQTVALLKYIKNSFIIIGISTFLSVLVSIFSGYALQRFVFKGKRLFGNFLIFAQMFPLFMILLPMYLLFVLIQQITPLRLVGTYTGVIITYLTFALPFSIWLMKGFFDTIPRELEEAAFIDGCGYFGTIFRIIVPVSIPGVIAVGTYSFLLGWQEVLFASVLTNEDTRTVAVGLANFSTTTSTYWNELMAASVTVTIPLVVIFLLMQKYLIAGLTAGSVKG